jgi:GT2 family glycosyltransferase
LWTTFDVNDPALLYIVITDFNGWTQTRECLLRLYRSSYKDIVVVVVDHGLTDETAQGLDDFSDCIRLSAGPEIWWSGATNQGIQFSLDRGAEQIMLLNNDCFVNEDTIAKLIRHSDALPGTVIAPRQYNAHNGQPVAANVATCFSLGFTTIQLPSFMGSKNLGENLLSTAIIVGGRGVILPARVFELVGLFDELDLPHYGADHDFYLRCTANDVPLAIATDASVSIDQTKTTLSRNLGQMSLREYVNSFSDPRSHRNLPVLKTLFKRYFPLPELYLFGVFLNVVRYTLIYILRRGVYLLRRAVWRTS